jgi:hypothetical protein
MITLPINQYAFLVAMCFSLGILLVYFVLLNILNGRRFGKNEDELQKLRLNTEKKQEAILERARYDYEAIITRATEQAEEIITNAKHLRQDSAGVLDSDFDKLITEQRLKLAETSDTIEKKYANQIDELNRKNVEILQSAYKDIISYSSDTFGVFKEDLEKATFDSKKLADEKINEQYQKLDAELEQKRKEAFEKINQNIYKVLLFVSKEAIGKQIPLEDQEELILQSLERAKKEILN